jgi:hypothetical protein
MPGPDSCQAIAAKPCHETRIRDAVERLRSLLLVLLDVRREAKPACG